VGIDLRMSFAVDGNRRHTMCAGAPVANKVGCNRLGCFTFVRIVDVDTGQRMNVRQAGLRTVGYLLSFATCGAGFLWVLFNDRKQTLHDRIANTTVVQEETREHVGQTGLR